MLRRPHAPSDFELDLETLPQRADESPGDRADATGGYSATPLVSCAPPTEPEAPRPPGSRRRVQALLGVPVALMFAGLLLLAANPVRSGTRHVAPAVNAAPDRAFVIAANTDPQPRARATTRNIRRNHENRRPPRERRQQPGTRAAVEVSMPRPMTRQPAAPSRSLTQRTPSRTEWPQPAAAVPAGPGEFF
jgi:hypothetical protein